MSDPDHPRPITRTDLAARVVASTDNSIYQVLPAAVATPSSAADVAALLDENHRRPTPLPVVARGGGTGTNGQSLTDGLVVDLKQRMNRLLSIDPDARIAVVEPGLVTAALNRTAARHGLVWAPHTSTLDRATVGGMIATDAAGKGSLVHGRTHRHVEAVDLCLADGSIVHLAPTTTDDAEHLARTDGATGRLWTQLLALAEHDHPSPTPQLARGWTGYGIDRLRRDDVIDPVQLVVGAEGTLGIVTRAWLRLTPLPTRTTMVVALYETFAAALDASISLADLRPTAIEAFDEATLDAGRSSPAWSTLGDVVGDRDGAVLVLEFDDAVDAADAVDAPGQALDVVRRSAPLAAALIDDERRADVWRVRADAVGLLARRVVHEPGSTGAPRAARPTAMVEDCAVPVASMPAFIAEFRRMFDEAGLDYGMFGHADVGCVHVRPALDLTDPAHEALVGPLTEQVVELVARHGGVLWGEHGRGMRGGSVERVLDPATLDAMRAVKTAFDPDDRCNPGKLYRPLGDDRPLIDVTEPPTRGAVDRRVPVELRIEHASAFACNGNGMCHDVERAAPMCPSYQATGDPARSPKGRADLLRAWLRQRADGAADAEFDADLAANLHECLSCAACSGRCPVEVDIPELKSQFLETYHADRRRPAADHVLARFETLAPFVARLPGPLTTLTRLAERPLGLVDLPVVPRRPTRRFDRFEPDADQPHEDDRPHVVLLPDVFSAVLDPDTFTAAHDALVGSGYRVEVAPLRPSGKFDHVKGRRRAFDRAVQRQRYLVDQVLDAGAVPIVVEPAVSILHAHEYRTALPLHRGDRVADLAEVLVDAPQRLPAVEQPLTVSLLCHCTEQARRSESSGRWRALLVSVGHDVEAIEVGCCGMAGVFGHERRNEEMSRALWHRNWQPVADRAGGVVAATGYSCRSQADRCADLGVVHPVRLLGV